MISPLWQKVKRTKKPLDEMKEESEKVTQHSDTEDHGIQDGEAMETVRDFVFLCSQMVTAAMKLKDACSLK